MIKYLLSFLIILLVIFITFSYVTNNFDPYAPYYYNTFIVDDKIKDYSKENLVDSQLSSKLKILHLVLHSPDEYYDKMYKLTREYYHKNKNIKTVYYCFSPDINSDYYLSDDILYIKGKETYLPGILDKTLLAIKYFEREIDNYDYIVRSNISTIIDFEKLEKLLRNNRLRYGGGIIFRLRDVDPKNGIHDKRYFGSNIVSGTSMIFSKELLKELIRNFDKIKRDVADDVSISLLVNDVFPKIRVKNFGKYFAVVEDFQKLNGKDVIFYRNKNNDRFLDIQNMTKIIDKLKKNY